MRKTFVCIMIMSIMTMLSADLLMPAKASPTAIEVVPLSPEAGLDEFLIVNITVDDITDLYLWMFRLEWNKTVFQLNSINEGPFLQKDGGTTSGIMISPLTIQEINDAGRIEEAACSLVGATPGVDGAGTIATLNFTCLSIGNTSLEFWMESPLHEPATDLLNSVGETIPHTALSATCTCIPELSGFATLLLLTAILSAVILGKKVFHTHLPLEDRNERR